ncbi:MAG: hypothetical protein ACXVHQ_38220, partial [Solirubrobacteraceae bacterium]
MTEAKQVQPGRPGASPLLAKGAHLGGVDRAELVTVPPGAPLLREARCPACSTRANDDRPDAQEQRPVELGG